MSSRVLLKYAVLSCIALLSLYLSAAMVAREYRKRNVALDIWGTSIHQKTPEQYYLFNGTSVYRLSSDRGQIYEAWEAISGAPDESGEFQFSEEVQKRPSEGPIPAGRYRIAVRLLEDISERNGIWSLEAWNRIATAPFWRRFLASGLLQEREPDKWGRFFVRLTPYPETNCFGRNFFVLHGGTEKGSRGCIDMGNNEVELFQDMLLHFQEAGGVDLWVDYHFQPPASSAPIRVKPAHWDK